MKIDYEALIIKNCPRLFSAVNQNEFSSSFGCLDRDFWHYKISKDFPSAVFQTGALALALLYKDNFSGNIYFKQKKVLKLTVAAISFWTKIQNNDGSFSEWYPYERSHVATAFTACAISEALLLLGSEVPEREKKAALLALEKAAIYLDRNPEKTVANHQAGAVLAFYNFYLLTSRQKFKLAAKRHLEILLNLQSPEGWFPEYGGADPGYLSVTVDFLARYWQKTKEEKALIACQRAVDFMSYFVHPDGSFGGEYGTRNTKFLLTGGLEILTTENFQAGHILDRFKVIDAYDERYLVFFFLGNWLQAKIEARKEKKLVSSFKREVWQTKDFSLAGISIYRSDNLYMILGYKKNGVLKVFRDDQLVFSDTGWWGRLKNKKIISSQWFDGKQSGLPIKTQFCLVPELNLKSKIIFFRLFNYILGRIGYLGHLLDWFIKKKYLKSIKMAPLSFERNVFFKTNKVMIEDKISLSPGVFLISLVRTSNAGQKYTPTANFFTTHDLFFGDQNDLAKILNQKRELIVTKTI